MDDDDVLGPDVNDYDVLGPNVDYVDVLGLSVDDGDVEALDVDDDYVLGPDVDDDLVLGPDVVDDDVLGPDVDDDDVLGPDVPGLQPVRGELYGAQGKMQQIKCGGSLVAHQTSRVRIGYLGRCRAHCEILYKSPCKEGDLSLKKKRKIECNL